MCEGKGKTDGVGGPWKRVVVALKSKKKSYGKF